MTEMALQDEKKLEKLLIGTANSGSEGLKNCSNEDLLLLYCHFHSHPDIGRHVGVGESTVSDIYRDAGLGWREIRDKVIEFAKSSTDDEPLSPQKLIESSELDRLMNQIDFYKSKLRRKEQEVDQLTNYYALYRDIISDTVQAFPEVPLTYPEMETSGEVDEELCILPISDVHIGECVVPERMGGLANYNWETFLHRIEEYKRGIHSIVNEHLRRSYPINTALVFCLGDWCFPGDEPVLMADSRHCPIKDIAVGDSVVSHRGVDKRVVDVMKRRYAGNLLSIGLRGRAKKIRCTPEHPILGITREDIWGKYCENGRSDRGRAGHQTNITMGAPVRKKHWEYIDENNLRFIPACELSVGDYVAMPRRVVQQQNPTVLDVPVRPTARNNICDEVVLDNDMARLLGYFCAEGSVQWSTNGKPLKAIFCMGQDEGVESIIIEDIRSILRRKFNIEAGIIKRPSDGGDTNHITCYSCRVAELLVNLCGGNSYDIHVPVNELLSAGREAVLSFVAAYTDGDGCRQQNKHDLAIKTASVSEDMTRGLITLLVSIGMFASYSVDSRGVYLASIPARYRNEIVKYSAVGEDSITLSKNCSYWHDLDNYVLLPISSISHEYYNDYVYNLEVEDDNSYIVNNIAVHNCSGEDVFHKQLANIDLKLTQQIFDGALRMAELIRWLSSQFKNVEVMCVSGNHGETKTTTLNTDYILYTIMATALANQSNVNCYISETHYMGIHIDRNQDLIDFGDVDKVWNFLITHGHQARSYNSVPFYSLERLVRRYSSMTGILWDKLFVGHHHQDVPGPRNAWCINGSWVGGTEYSQTKMQGNDQPCQRIWGFHPNRGLTWTYSIDLDEHKVLEMRPNDNGIYTPYTMVSKDENGNLDFELHGNMEAAIS